MKGMHTDIKYDKTDMASGPAITRILIMGISIYYMGLFKLLFT